MRKNSNEILCQLIQQQNRLLERQNEVLNRLVDRNDSGEVSLLDGEKIFVEDLWHDEIRDGFKVTVKRKRLWNIQLNLVDEFVRLCLVESVTLPLRYTQ